MPSPYERRNPPTLKTKVYPNGVSRIPPLDRRQGRFERLQFPHYEVPIGGCKSLKAPVKLMFLSDIHYDKINAQWSNNALPHLIEEINKQKIDALIFGGDYICQGDGFIRDLGKWVASLNRGIPMLGIMGNHDYLDGANGSKVKSTMENAGVRMLVNESYTQDFGKKGSLTFHGLDDYLLGKPNLDGAIKSLKEQPHQTHVGLIHNPKQLEHFSTRGVFDLSLSGHTHGGQIGFNHLMAQWLTWQKYVGGLYWRNSLKGYREPLFVGKGWGTGSILVDEHHAPELEKWLRRIGIHNLAFAVPRWWEAFSEAPSLLLTPSMNHFKA
jgi:predicted MPP superfamily phosphohydrolase